ncbi:MAG: hypothetical protein C4570_07785 [Ammonifex sp.]|nr:MAG: hypothetical protein C4570_07785 [Ammonifex sp.]
MFAVETKSFEKALRAVQLATSITSPLLTLHQAMLEYDNTGVQLTATDLDVTVQVRLRCLRVVGCGEFLLDPRDVLAFIKDTSAVTYEGGKFICGNKTMEWYQTPVEEYPGIGKGAVFCWTTRQQLGPDFITGLAKCLPFASKGLLRPVFTCLKCGRREIAATDTHRLMVYYPDIQEDLHECLIPGKAAKAVIYLAKMYGVNGLEMRHNESSVRFCTDTFTVYSRKEEGRYPQYQVVLGDTPKKHAVIDVGDLLGLVKNVPRETAVALNVNGDHIQANYKTERCTIGARIPAKLDPPKSDSLEIHVQGVYLKDLLESLRDRGTINLGFIGPNNPIIVRGRKEASILLPLRVS